MLRLYPSPRDARAQLKQLDSAPPTWSHDMGQAPSLSGARQAAEEATWVCCTCCMGLSEQRWASRTFFQAFLG